MDGGLPNMEPERNTQSPITDDQPFMENIQPGTEQTAEHRETSEDDTPLQSEKAVDQLANLHEALSKPIPEKMTALEINDASQQLVDRLNEKRKTDQQLVHEFKQALEEQGMQAVQQLEQQLYELYKVESAQVDAKLQQLHKQFHQIDGIETEMGYSRQQLHTLFQELQKDLSV